jgi:hypothetical protein
VRYGLTADESHSRGDPSWRDINVDYRELSTGARVPGAPRERQKFFFSERIMTDEETKTLRDLQTQVQTYSDNLGVGTPNAESRASGIEEVQAETGRRDGGGHHDTLDDGNRDQFGVDTDYWGY